MGFNEYIASLEGLNRAIEKFNDVVSRKLGIAKEELNKMIEETGSQEIVEMAKMDAQDQKAENHKYIDNMIAEVKDGTMNIDEVMTDMFGEGGKEEVKEFYRQEREDDELEIGEEQDLSDNSEPKAIL